MRSPRPPGAPLDDAAEIRRWLGRWSDAGLVLEAERWDAIAAMTPAELQRATARVLDLWQPGWPADDGGRPAARAAPVRARPLMPPAHPELVTPCC